MRSRAKRRSGGARCFPATARIVIVKTASGWEFIPVTFRLSRSVPVFRLPEVKGFTEEPQFDVALCPLPVLGDVQANPRLIRKWPMEQTDDVGILLNRAAVAQISEPGFPTFTVAIAIELRQNY